MRPGADRERVVRRGKNVIDAAGLAKINFDGTVDLPDLETARRGVEAVLEEGRVALHGGVGPEFDGKTVARTRIETRCAENAHAILDAIEPERSAQFAIRIARRVFKKRLVSRDVIVATARGFPPRDQARWRRR